MTFVRRSRKGRIHVVRERVAGGYKRLAKGLARANNNVMGGVWQAHKGLQLGLAKGHQSIQSGLKTVQDITGDFNMYQSNSYYQYQPPVAMFSMAEVDKYNQYSDNGMAYFETRALPGYGTGARGVKVPGSTSGSFKAKWQRKEIQDGFRSAARKAGESVGGAARGVGNVAGKPLDAVGRRLGEMAWKNPKLAGAAALGALAVGGAAGVGGATFLRRRRTKSGKIVMEQVRR